MDDEIVTPLDRLGQSLREAIVLEVANAALRRSMRRIRLAGQISMMVGVVLGFMLPHSAVSLVTILVTLALIAGASWRWL